MAGALLILFFSSLSPPLSTSLRLSPYVFLVRAAPSKCAQRATISRLLLHRAVSAAAAIPAHHHAATAHPRQERARLHHTLVTDRHQLQQLPLELRLLRSRLVLCRRGGRAISDLPPAPRRRRALVARGRARALLLLRLPEQPLTRGKGTRLSV